MYSMFSEMLRLIPPERTIVESEGPDEFTTRHEDEGENKEEGAHVSEQHSRPSRDEQPDTQDKQEDSKMWEPSAPSFSVNPVAGREEDIPRQGIVHPAFSLGDLDALLRF